jgi:hypothetical protein
VDSPPQRQRRFAREGESLREQGLNYDRIAAELGVAKSSVSYWVRDLPWPERLSYEECRKRAAEGVRRYWAVERPIRAAHREAARAAAAAEIGSLTQRELLIADWCEGGKSKPYKLKERVAFINGDPGLVTFFLRFLDAAGVDRRQIRYRLCIHESADHDAAQRFWIAVTGADQAQFYKPTLKRHTPRTVRKNVGDNYHGCLRIDVQQSAGLYRRIEGWVRAAISDQ